MYIYIYIHIETYIQTYLYTHLSTWVCQGHTVTLRSTIAAQLLHDAKELFLVHFAISITIRFINHLLTIFAFVWPPRDQTEMST